MRKSIAGIAIGASVLAGGAGGALLFTPQLVGAQTDETDETTDETTESETRFADHLVDTLAPLVEDGTITQAQADAVIEALEASRPERPFLHFGLGLHEAAEELAEVLGITTDELRDALADGQTLAEIAEANGVEAQSVIDVIVAAGNERIDEALENGRIDEDEATEHRAELEDRATEIVNGTFEGPMGGRGGPGHHGGRFGGGPFGDSSGTTDDSTDSTDDTDA